MIDISATFSSVITLSWPSDLWWVSPVALVALGATAVTDSFTSRVPDAVVIPTTLALLIINIFYRGWEDAALLATVALAFGGVLWLTNALWWVYRREDALGMGDAKWTMAGVIAFGLLPLLWAWGLGALLALTWMGWARLFNKPIARVYFVPFLFLGLLGGLALTDSLPHLSSHLL